MFFINCYFNLGSCKIIKKIIFDNKKNKVGIYYKIRINENINGSIRLNHITLNPKIYKKNLYFETNNGGKKIEKFMVGRKILIMGKQFHI